MSWKKLKWLVKINSAFKRNDNSQEKESNPSVVTTAERNNIEGDRLELQMQMTKIGKLFKFKRGSRQRELEQLKFENTNQNVDDNQDQSEDEVDGEDNAQPKLWVRKNRQTFECTKCNHHQVLAEEATFCALYSVIVYYLTAQPVEGFRFGMFISTCLLISFVAQSVGLVVGAAMSVQNGVFLAPVMSVPFLLFSGFFVSFESIPIYLRWITYLSYIRYGFEGTALATYGYNRANLLCQQEYCHFKNPKSTLKELDMTNSAFQVDIYALIFIFAILRATAYLFLKWKLHSVR